jgi:hypothetical protein
MDGGSMSKSVTDDPDPRVRSSPEPYGGGDTQLFVTPERPDHADQRGQVPAAEVGPSNDPQGPLSPLQEEILAFERQWWKYAGAKESAVRDRFDMSSTRYYQVLNVLIDRPAALAFDPLLVNRLRRLRSARQLARSARRRLHS